MPRRVDVDDFFAQLEDHQRDHLEALRSLSREVAPTSREELRWNLPTYLVDDSTHLWMLQNFKRHCSLRFSVEFFSSHRDDVEAAGEECGAGFVKLPYERKLPVELLTWLLRARLADAASRKA